MSIFSKVGGLKPKLTAFNLSHTHLYDCGFGELVPVACLETVPGDVFKIDANIIGRLTSALKSPILSQMDIVLEAFYCPTRLLMGRDANFETPVGEVTWEEFISGGKDGSHIGSESYPLPLFGLKENYTFTTGGLGDHLGVQVGTAISAADLPLAFPWRAYRWIWNEYYRDENLMPELQVSEYLGNGTSSDNTRILAADYDSLLRRCWRKDYFTSALPFQQRGTSPALPINGVLPVSFGSEALLLNSPKASYNSGGMTFTDIIKIKNDGTLLSGLTPAQVSNVSSLSGTPAGLTGSVDLSDAATFDVNQIRTAFQVQKWLERNARGGIRYTEYLRSHFGIAPSDARLQRPQFIGSCRSPWLVNEVLQTSETNTSVTPQGNQAGQAINLSRNNLGKFRSYEYGYILVLASVVPKALYQQGIPKYLSRRHNLDFYTPEFAHLSEQPVKNKEIFYTADSLTNDDTFGFQPIWNEMRFIPSKVTGHMRTGASGYSFDYWHFGRYFAGSPKLDKDFLSIGGSEASKSELMRIFAVQDENPFIINVGLNIKALRPMPYLSEPGLIDHF
nr:MAG: major capsid protein [Cressdnaviricota sp.]